MRVPQNIMLDQFMFDAVTGCASGQNAKKMIGRRNRSAAMLM